MFRSGKKKNQKILEHYKSIKDAAFDFERIGLFFLHTDKTDAHQIISDSTFQDLDFEELFMYMDRTCSKIGQQLLYANLRTLPKNKKRTLQHEKIINYLNENPEIKAATVLEMSRLNEPGAYFLQQLIYGKNIVKPKWFWVIPLLSGLSIATLLLSFFFPVLVPVFIPILVINTIFHYWNKKNILTYSNSIPQLLLLNQVAHKMIHSGVILDNIDQIQKSTEAIGKISRLAVFFQLEAKLTSEIGQVIDYLLDLIKATFLLEPMLIFKIIGELELKKTEISKLFITVAQVDVALSISSFREALPYFAFPDITDKKKPFYSKEIYHPLLLNPVANNIDLSDGKSVLISGSNMSGKTTFIRTMGINAILSQTINTACAKELVMPVLKVHSAIRIADNLLDDTSYYYKEVKAIKKMIEESESAHQNLFLLDELFKGTNTIERIASGKAVLTYLNRADNLVFASTHDLELTEFLNENYNYFHFAELIENDLLTFDFKLKTGKLTNTNAIRILEINDFPKEITEEAKTMARQMSELKRITSAKNP
jgi:hypothetical protein